MSAVYQNHLRSFQSLRIFKGAVSPSSKAVYRKCLRICDSAYVQQLALHSKTTSAMHMLLTDLVAFVLSLLFAGVCCSRHLPKSLSVLCFIWATSWSVVSKVGFVHLYIHGCAICPRCEDTDKYIHSFVTVDLLPHTRALRLSKDRDAQMTWDPFWASLCSKAKETACLCCKKYYGGNSCCRRGPDCSSNHGSPCAQVPPSMGLMGT